METILVSLQDEIETLHQYFTHINCQPFSGHNKKLNDVEITY